MNVYTLYFTLLNTLKKEFFTNCPLPLLFARHFACRDVLGYRRQARDGWDHRQTIRCVI